MKVIIYNVGKCPINLCKSERENCVPSESDSNEINEGVVEDGSITPSEVISHEAEVSKAIFVISFRCQRIPLKPQKAACEIINAAQNLQ